VFENVKKMNIENLIIAAVEEVSSNQFKAQLLFLIAAAIWF